MTKEDKIKLLLQYKERVIYWRNNKDPESRSYLHQKIQLVRKIIDDAHCTNTMTITPPPVVGGPILRNVDPLSVMFDPPFMMDLTKVVIDNLDQTIGVLESGILEIPIEKDKSVPIKRIQSTEKITARWLIDHMPISMWLTLGGMLISAFTFGYWAHSVFVK